MSTVQYPATEMLGDDSPTVPRSTRSNDSVGVTPAVRRAPVRSAVYMGALVATRQNPIIKDFYQRFLAVGKPKMVALTACMRKLLTILNAMVRSNTVWRRTNPQTA